ncbi:MAG: pyruvate formate lyase family protein [Anaerolineales bacterium]
MIDSDNWKVGEPTYQQRIDALRETKREHTDIKIERDGHFDTDDHGYIPWTEPIPFEPVYNHPEGGCYGIKCIGENFRRWLEVHPVYIHPMSSLAGAWVHKGIPGVNGRPLPCQEVYEDRGTLRGDGYPRNWRPEDRPSHLYPLHEKYNIYNPGIGSPNHLGPDMQIGLDLGWGGLLDKIRRYRERNRPEDTSFYDGEEQLVLGIQTWIRRHVTRAREMAAAEENPVLRENLLDMVEINEWVVAKPPRTFREACQFLVWFQSVDRMWGLGGAMGQLDELLLPYYESDLEAGTEDEESFVWHLSSLFFNDPHYSQIGGQAPDGRDLTSPVSFLVLEAMHQLRTPSNIALRVHEDMDPGLLRQAVTNICEDGTGVSFACSKGLDEGFARNGFPNQLARMRAKVGCNWTALPGVEYCLQDVTRLCLVMPLLLALDEVVSDEDMPETMDALWDRYAHHLGVSVDTVKEGKDIHMEHQADNYPEIVLNLFCHGPIERGLDAAAGGVDIIDLAMDGIGLATVADSFAAIEQRVVEEGRLTWQELVQHLEDDFADAERVRLMLNNIPRYGAGGTRADWWAKRVADLWDHLVRDTPTENGWRCIPGLFSHGGVNKYGEKVGATPNGRHAGEPVSHSADPDPGFLPGGAVAVTAKANAVAEVQPRWGNTTPLQIELDHDLVNDLGGMETIENLIKTHNRQGGTLINMNVVSKEQVLEAHADPSTHPDLMVRVTGYSAYFNSLSREYRQPIVDRILQES